VRTALVFLVPDAEPLISDLRQRHDPSAGDGMPAHVTVLYPFREWETIDRPVLLSLGCLHREVLPMELAFSTVGRFPGVRWLCPEPRAPIDWLTQAIVRAFPDCPPYGGEIADPTPHLTFAIGDETVLDEVERELVGRIMEPIRGCIEASSLFAFSVGRW
jgi:hypothetical protein